MLRPQRSKGNRSPVSRTKTIPAPTGGWNARDSLAEMQPNEAPLMDNWWPRTSDVINRRGYLDWATGLPGQVNTLLAYTAPTASKLFAASVSGIYDVTSSGAVGAVVQAITNSKLQYTNITTAGGNYLYAVNATDKALLYDGTTWKSIDGASTPAITGIATTTFSQVLQWKHRLFFVQANSNSVWYLPTDSIGGAASEINFGPLFKYGGKIAAIMTWTIDGGYGMDDHLVIMTSQGEVAVYRGTDPAVAANFLLIGVYNLGNPIGDRCWIKFGGDIVLITLDGFEPLSNSLLSTRTNNRIAVSDKISGAVTDATTLYQFNFGWQPVLFPKENMLIVNVPVNPGIENHQYVMNTITGAWCRFRGWNANVFELFGDNLYFGTSGKVCKAWQGLADGTGNITTEIKQAFSYFDDPARLKQWKMARPIFMANQSPPLQISLNVDFGDDGIYSAVNSPGSSAALWDVALWDQGLWAGTQIYKDWTTVGKLGYCAALRMKIASNTLDNSWASTDYLYEYGGTI